MLIILATLSVCSLTAADLSFNDIPDHGVHVEKAFQGTSVVSTK